MSHHTTIERNGFNCPNPTSAPYNTLLDKMKRSIYNSLCWNVHDSETNIQNHKCRMKSAKVKISAEFKLPPKNNQERQNGVHDNEQNHELQKKEKVCPRKSQKNQIKENKYETKHKRCGGRHCNIDVPYYEGTSETFDGEKVRNTKKSTCKKKLPDNSDNFECHKLLPTMPSNYKQILYSQIDKRSSRINYQCVSKPRQCQCNRQDKPDRSSYYSKHRFQGKSFDGSRRTPNKRLDDDIRYYKNKYNINEIPIKQRTPRETCRRTPNREYYHRYNNSLQLRNKGNMYKDLSNKILKDEDCRRFTEKGLKGPKYAKAMSSLKNYKSETDSICTSCQEDTDDRESNGLIALPETKEKLCKQVYELSKDQCKSFKEKGYIKVNVKVKPNVSVSDFNIIIKKDKSKAR